VPEERPDEAGVQPDQGPKHRHPARTGSQRPRDRAGEAGSALRAAEGEAGIRLAGRAGKGLITAR
jgi:hypothetical protein